MLESIPGGDRKLLVACTGIQLRGSPQEKAQWMLNQFESLVPFQRTRYDQNTANSVDKWISGTSDLGFTTSERQFNWDYDLKRRPDIFGTPTSRRNRGILSTNSQG